jgi:hypothetical protein
MISPSTIFAGSIYFARKERNKTNRTKIIQYIRISSGPGHERKGSKRARKRELKEYKPRKM